MRGLRAKKIRQLVINKTPAVFFSVRNIYKEKTEQMEQEQIYQAAKKIWTSNRNQLIKRWR